jgi:hypothetical protein
MQESNFILFPKAELTLSLQQSPIPALVHRLDRFAGHHQAHSKPDRIGEGATSECERAEEWPEC